MLDLIGPEKDVDGLHPLNIGRKLLNNLFNFRPCFKKAQATILFMHSSWMPKIDRVSM